MIKYTGFNSKIQQTKMLVTCQRFSDLFLHGRVWKYFILGGQFFAKQLTLSHPGRHIMPTTVLGAPSPGFSDLATTLLWRNIQKNETQTKSFLMTFLTVIWSPFFYPAQSDVFVGLKHFLRLATIFRILQNCQK